MSRYIDAEAFEKDTRKRYCEPCWKDKRDHNGIRCRACWVDDMLGEVADAPTADVREVKHAHWTSDGHCTECGMLSQGFYRNFCPFCGANMDEKEKTK